MAERTKERAAVDAVLASISGIMSENREFLIKIDGVIGDGDLGITMDKAFSAAAEGVVSLDEPQVPKALIEAGKIMAKNAPSTMGTLMATGFMYGGKALGEEEMLSAGGLYAFFKGFLEGVEKRGKAKPGEKTLLDVLDPVVRALEAKQEADLSDALEAAMKAAEEGLKATEKMVSQHGKAAVYREQTLGKQDPGATAMLFVVKGFREALTTL
ncbi:dihydroxyacetone kinase subunit L [Sediminispirochaeta smaragdinae]|uniref:Dak phosphatase n=1 Tax=Sediminispirochaeta smaragdinae (strain DSM 11293 / JCM 15392 / SEBR 4228) TaxID=573413 RepID=E1R6V0_SEDSS|nr:dihydroxyacetone kinase subunit L [Sediminispirochaeta smaragdinae]ADK79232.1 Dak phosphatase [Sediminispirochaeta smaragdinae DSM 11293]